MAIQRMKLWEMDRRILSSPSSILPLLKSLSQKYRTPRVISDATKPRISFSLRLQPFNSSIGQRGGYGFLSGMFFVCWRYSRSFDRIKGLWNRPVQLFYPGAISDRLQIAVLQLVASLLRIACPFRIVALSKLAYRRPTASHRCPSWSPWGCRESCWIA